MVDDDRDREDFLRQRSREILANTEPLDDYEERARQNRLAEIMSRPPAGPAMIIKRTENALVQRTPSLNSIIDKRIKAALDAVLPGIVANERKRVRGEIATALAGLTFADELKRISALLDKLEKNFDALSRMGNSADPDDRWQDFKSH